VGEIRVGPLSPPNYSDDEVIEVIRVTTSAVFTVTNLVTKHFGFEDDWKNVGQMFEQWASIKQNSVWGRRVPAMARCRWGK